MSTTTQKEEIQHYFVEEIIFSRNRGHRKPQWVDCRMKSGVVGSRLLDEPMAGMNLEEKKTCVDLLM